MGQTKHVLKDTVFLTAGGTGGHVFPAEALAQSLKQQGYEVHILTDRRARRFITTGENGFAAQNIHVLASATFSLRRPLSVIKAAWQLSRGFFQARKLIKRHKPAMIIGFGGYPTVPPLMAAHFAKTPILLHEQNSVMGRANRFLARYAQKVATGFPIVNPDEAVANKIIETGNPLRPAVIEASKIAYKPAKKDEDFHLLIFGGSQGASFFSTILPQAIGLLPLAERKRLKIIQQVRVADQEALEKAYHAIDIKAKIAPFFDNLPALMAQSQFIIGRAGASTVAEIAVIGRPALLVPYPGALDHDQRHNGQGIARSGGVEMIEQSALSPQKLATILSYALENPHDMAQKAQAVYAVGQRSATEKLVALVKQYQAKN